MFYNAHLSLSNQKAPSRFLLPTRKGVSKLKLGVVPTQSLTVNVLYEKTGDLYTTHIYLGNKEKAETGFSR